MVLATTSGLRRLLRPLLGVFLATFSPNAIHELGVERAPQEITRFARNQPVFSPPAVFAVEKAEAQNLLQSIEPLAPINRLSDDFWYPPFMIGKWKTEISFTGAEFSSVLPTDRLTLTGHLPGLQKFSIALLPEIGRDAVIERRYVQVDSHPREDHPFNLRQVVHAFSPETIIDNAAYAFQRAPNWFSSPANRWKISYHDKTGHGVFELVTKKRSITVFAGSINAVEYIHQKHTRQEEEGSSNKAAVVSQSDYAMQWQISSRDSSQDRFVTVEELSKSDELLGKLNVYAFFQPSDDLYFLSPGRPAAVYSYDLHMQREAATAEAKHEEVIATEYPFVPYQVGPVELEKFFGY